MKKIILLFLFIIICITPTYCEYLSGEPEQELVDISYTNMGVTTGSGVQKIFYPKWLYTVDDLSGLYNAPKTYDEATRTQKK